MLVSQLTWHVPNDEEIDFVLEIFRELIEPALDMLEDLLKQGRYLFRLGGSCFISIMFYRCSRCCLAQ